MNLVVVAALCLQVVLLLVGYETTTPVYASSTGDDAASSASAATASTASNTNKKINVDLGAVQETLLIPLIGRAMITKEYPNGDGLIYDEKSVEIVSQLNYDFSHWESTTSVYGAVLRTRILDQDVQQFINKYPGGCTIVEIGCGLNDRKNRLTNTENVIWFDLDMPDTIQLRKQFYDYSAETGSNEKDRYMIAASVLDYDKWIPQVKEKGGPDGPWLFVSEAVIVYLDEDDVKQFFQTIVNEFHHAWIVIDTLSESTKHSQDQHPLLKHLSSDSYFRWACDEPQVTIPQWTNNQLYVLQQRTYTDAGKELIAKAPYPFNTLSPDRPMTVRTKFNIFVTEQDKPKEENDSEKDKKKEL